MQARVRTHMHAWNWDSVRTSASCLSTTSSNEHQCVDLPLANWLAGHPPAGRDPPSPPPTLGWLEGSTKCIIQWQLCKRPAVQQLWGLGGPETCCTGLHSCTHCPCVQVSAAVCVTQGKSPWRPTASCRPQQAVSQFEHHHRLIVSI